jgi:hypothetical protein
MSVEDPTAEGSETEYSMVVNGSLVVVPHDEVSYEEVTSIAYPVPPAPDMKFHVVYDHAKAPDSKGILKKGGVVTIKKDGTEFDVSPTGKS